MESNEDIENELTNFKTEIAESAKQLKDVIKENNQTLNALAKLSKESEEGIIALKIYGEQETPVLKDAFIGLSEALRTIEDARLLMVSSLQEEFILPLNNVIKGWPQVQKEIKEDIISNRKLMKFKKRYDSVKEKPKEKLKAGKLEEIEDQYQIISDSARKEHQDVIDSIKNYQENKSITLKNCLNALVSKEKKFHQLASSKLTDITMYIDMIVPEEIDFTTFSGEVQESAKNYRKNLSKIQKVIVGMRKGLGKVIKENKEMLDAQMMLKKESQESISAFKDFALNESKSFSEALESLAGSLEIIEVNREAFVKQMEFEFITPLNDLVMLLRDLKSKIKKEEKSINFYEKKNKKLENLKIMSPEKLNKEYLSKREQEFSEIAMKKNVNHKLLIDFFNKFNEKKANTIKDSLNSYVERNLKFHNQALNIIDSSELLIEAIKLK